MEGLKLNNLFILLKSLLLIFVVNLPFSVQSQNSKIHFWDQQQKGTNFFNAVPTRQWFESAAAANIKFVRLTYEKWKGTERDFLIGNVDEYKGIIEPDFQKLLQILNIADSLDIKIVITPISLPGARWVQSNNRVNDGRLWQNKKYQEQTCRFWKDLAQRLKNHPAVVGYNIQNEPHPEIFLNQNKYGRKGYSEWYKSFKGTPGDLNLFYENVIMAIREADKETPIVVEPGLYATDWAIEYLEKFDDPYIIYSFHVYDPYRFTTWRINNGKYSYGDKMPDEDTGDTIIVNKKFLEEAVQPVSDWASRNYVPANRIWAGEFGCSRRVKGVVNYFSDLIDIFNKNQWHWSFYSYREDVWDSMDYELGTGDLPPKYWEYANSKTLNLHYNEIYRQVKNNPVWPVFQKEFKTNQ